MKPEKRAIPSSEHEQVYHAAVRCQAASLSLTARRLHGLKNACSVEGKKTGGFASQRKMLLSRSGRMQMSGLLKSRVFFAREKWLMRIFCGARVKLCVGRASERTRSEHAHTSVFSAISGV